MRPLMRRGVVGGIVCLLITAGVAGAQDPPAGTVPDAPTPPSSGENRGQQQGDASGITIVEGLTHKIALGWSNEEKQLPITVRAASGELPATLKVTVTGFAETDGGAQINRKVGFRTPGKREITATRTLTPAGARTQNLNLIFGEGGTDAGTFNGQVFVDSDGTTIGQVDVTATAQNLNPVYAFGVLLVAGLAGGFLVRQLQKFRSLRDQEKRLELIDQALLGVGPDLLPSDLQTQLGRARSALAQRDAAVAAESLKALEAKLIVGGLAQFARARLVPIRTAIEEQAENLRRAQSGGSSSTPFVNIPAPIVNASDAEDGRALIGAQRYRLGILVELAGTDLSAARTDSEKLTERVRSATERIATLSGEGLQAQSLARHLLDDAGWRAEWTPPAEKTVRVPPRRAMGPLGLRRVRRGRDGRADSRSSGRKFWDAITSPRAVLIYGMLVSLTLVSLVGLQVLYLGDPTFGNDGLADWIGLVAWGVGIQAGASSTLGLLRSVTPQAGLDLIGPAPAPGTPGDPEDGGGQAGDEPAAEGAGEAEGAAVARR